MHLGSAFLWELENQEIRPFYQENMINLTWAKRQFLDLLNLDRQLLWVIKFYQNVQTRRSLDSPKVPDGIRRWKLCQVQAHTTLPEAIQSTVARLRYSFSPVMKNDSLSLIHL